MGNFEERYAKLNKAQKEAVDSIDGPVLVVAGPGSGKTELLALRIANILKLTDAPASSLLCLTFTESAATNMRQRLVNLIGLDGYKVAIHTFHSFGTEIIGKFPEYFYSGAKFKPADELIQRSVIEDIIKELPYDNDFKKSHPEQGLTYIKDITSAISNLKKAGLSPKEFEDVLKENEEFILRISDDVNRLMSDRVSKKILPGMLDFVDNFLRHQKGNQNIPPLEGVLLDNWRMAIQESLDLDATTPFTQWKEKNTKKVGEKRILTEEHNLPKLQSLALVYERYQQEMYQRGYYDFDDMLLQVIAQMETNETLRAELQEKYLYISVDEFQDTNDAQMRILYNLVDSEVSEGMPNVMAVGDDDQAIYKFQGAEIGNIYKFKNRFREPKIITLTHNYRSGQSILDLARKIVLQGKNRLENLFPEEINKQLLAAGKNASLGVVENKVFSSPFYENAWVVKKIQQLIEQGIKPERIAVLSRNHKNFGPIIPLFNTLNIPVQYQKEGNVLESQPILQLIQILRFLATVNRQNVALDESFLPEILSYPFWKIDPLTIWKVSTGSHKERKSWTTYILESGDAHLQGVMTLLMKLGQSSISDPFDALLLAILDDTGFKNHYFGDQIRGKGDGQYLEFLADLNTFIGALTGYFNGKQMKVEQVLKFVDLHLKNNLEITRKSDFIPKSGAVNLMTAHKAKGLEFEAVFVINCVNSVWSGKGKSNLISFPQNLSLTPESDDIDDQMRLFFVALTRAERLLFLTSYLKEDSGNPVMKLSFLSFEDGLEDAIDDEAEAFEKELNVLELAQGKVLGKKEFTESERDWLLRLVEDYRISASDLKNFLDVGRGGPSNFFEKRILKFPQPKSPQATFGSIMHAILTEMYMALKKTGAVPSKELVLKQYEELLEKEYMAEPDQIEYLERGRRAIEAYYLEKVKEMSPTDAINVSFYNQGAVVNEAHLTGEIDKIVKAGSHELIICDYKTGKAMTKWSKSEESSFNHKNQLMFYKLLLNHSRDYSRMEVNSAYLDFLEPTNAGESSSNLELVLDKDEILELSQLIGIVYKKIINLDFPDVSIYEPGVKGIQQFKEDLLSGVV